MKLAYKITFYNNCMNRSINEHLKNTIVYYNLNEWTKSPTSTGLFVFKRLKDAKNFLRTLGYTFYDIFLCETLDLTETPKQFHPWNTEESNPPIVDSPKGTYTTPALKLLRKISLEETNYIPENVFKKTGE